MNELINNLEIVMPYVTQGAFLTLVLTFVKRELSHIRSDLKDLTNKFYEAVKDSEKSHNQIYRDFGVGH